MIVMTNNIHFGSQSLQATFLQTSAWPSLSSSECHNTHQRCVQKQGFHPRSDSFSTKEINSRIDKKYIFKNIYISNGKALALYSASKY